MLTVWCLQQMQKILYEAAFCENPIPLSFTENLLLIYLVGLTNKS